MMATSEEDKTKMEELCEKLTHSGKKELDEQLLVEYKNLCIKNNSNMKLAHKQLMEMLEKKHSEVRYGAFLLCDHLFRLHANFRELMLPDLPRVVNLTVGSADKSEPLPPPKCAAKAMRQFAVLRILDWYNQFSSVHRELKYAYTYLSTCIEINFAELEMKRSVAMASSAETNFKAVAEKAQQLKKTISEMKESFIEINTCCTSVKNALELLLPSPESFYIPDPPDVHQISYSSKSTELTVNLGPGAENINGLEISLLRENGVINLKRFIAIDKPSAPTVVITEDNESVVEAIRESYRLIAKRYLPQVKAWHKVLEKNKDEAVIDGKFASALLSLMLKLVQRCKQLQLVEHIINSDDDEDSSEEEMQELPQKEGFEASVGDALLAELIRKKVEQRSKQSALKVSITIGNSGPSRSSIQQSEMPGPSGPIEIEQQNEVPGPSGPVEIEQQNEMPGPRGPIEIEQQNEMPGPRGPIEIEQQNEMPGPSGPIEIEQQNEMPGPSGPIEIEQQNEMPGPSGPIEIEQQNEMPGPSGPIEQQPAGLYTSGHTLQFPPVPPLKKALRKKPVTSGHTLQQPAQPDSREYNSQQPAQFGPVDHYSQQPTQPDSREYNSQQPAQFGPVDPYSQQPTQPDGREYNSQQPAQFEPVDHYFQHPTQPDGREFISQQSAQFEPVDDSDSESGSIGFNNSQQPAQPEPVDDSDSESGSIGFNNSQQPAQPNPMHFYSQQPAQPNPMHFFPQQPAQPNPMHIFPQQPAQPNPMHFFPQQPAQPNPMHFFPQQPAQPNPMHFFPQQPAQPEPVDDSDSDSGSIGFNNSQQPAQPEHVDDSDSGSDSIGVQPAQPTPRDHHFQPLAQPGPSAYSSFQHLGLPTSIEMWQNILRSQNLPYIQARPMFDLHQVWSAARQLFEDAMPPQVTSIPIEFPSVFIPVKWKCRVPLPSGILCPREDRFKCPIHGPVVPRDEHGRCTRPEDARAEAERLSQYQRQHPDWQNPQLMAELEQTTGLDLRMPVKGQRKEKTPQFPGLTPLKRKQDSVRDRLSKKLSKKHRN